MSCRISTTNAGNVSNILKVLPVLPLVGACMHHFMIFQGNTHGQKNNLATKAPFGEWMLCTKVFFSIDMPQKDYDIEFRWHISTYTSHTRFCIMHDCLINNYTDSRLTIQTFQVNDTDFGHMMYNASLPWEELIHPWVTCARVSLTRPMGDEVMQITRYAHNQLHTGTKLDEHITIGLIWYYIFIHLNFCINLRGGYQRLQCQALSTLHYFNLIMIYLTTFILKTYKISQGTCVLNFK